MSEADRKRGASDAAQNKDHPPRSSFTSNKAHQDYLGGRSGK